jgi:hypothetical protein
MENNQRKQRKHVKGVKQKRKDDFIKVSMFLSAVEIESQKC